MFLSLDPEIKANFSSEKTFFDEIMQLRGELYREQKNRRTQNIILNGQSYFIKQHFGIGWKEILKNLFQLRIPITSAKNEWLALKALHQAKIPVPQIVGYGWRGRNPATRESFIITRTLPDCMSLEDLIKTWNLNFALKMKLIDQIATIARVLHHHGINHCDFYICHFLLDLIEYKKQQTDLRLYLIDLHRAQMRTHIPTRWIIKDLAGLYFSSKEIGLTQRDVWRFVKKYRDQPLRQVLNKETTFWWKVKKRGDKLFAKLR